MRPEALILALAIAAAGCAPKIEGFHLSDGVEGQPVVARAEISGGGTTLMDPELRFLELTSGNGTLGNAIPMQASSEENWTGSIEGLTYGQYEVRLRVPYSSTWGVSSKRETALLWIRPRPECFAFDQEEQGGLLGWTLDGVYDGGTATQVKPEGAPDLTLAWSPAQWPTTPGSETSGPAGGSLRVEIPAGCVPSEAAAVPSGWWRLDFVSPDLTGNAAWQGLTQIALRVVAEFPVSVQPAVVYRTAEGEFTAVPLDPEDEDILFFECRPGRWEAVTSAPIVPTGAEVIQVRVRIFGRPTEGAPGSVWLDSACPVRD